MTAIIDWLRKIFRRSPIRVSLNGTTSITSKEAMRQLRKVLSEGQ